MLARGVAALIGTTARRVADTSDVRKIVHFSRVTANLIQNFPIYHAGLQARHALSHGPDKTGSQTVKQLTVVGRRLTSVDFVAFLLLYHDLQDSRVAPFAAEAEKLSLEPTEISGRLRNMLDRLRGPDRAHLEQLHVWLAISVLLGAYMPETDLQSLWRALRYSPMGRTYPTFTERVFELMWRLQFRTCKIIWQHDEQEVDRSGRILLSPRCQCSSRRRRPRPDLVDGVRVGPTVPVFMRAWGRNVAVPEWVAESPYDRRAD